VEKPAALNAEEAQALAEAAAAVPGKILMEAAHYRYHPAMKRFGQLLASKELGKLQSLQARFSIVDPKAFLDAFIGREATSVAERQHERVKNLDRWWYCADALLVATGATEATVLSATEGRYSISASLSLDVGGSSVEASIDMARDSILSPYDWGLSATMSGGRVDYTNMGFPFLWHSISVQRSSKEPDIEQLYGLGETTFEHQLAAFVDAIRTERQPPSSTFSILKTMTLVDAVLQHGSQGPLGS